MAEHTWLDYAAAIGAIATPILVALLGALGWRLRTRLERQLQLEDQLRSDRVEIYNEILEPFVILLTTDAAWQAGPKNRNRDKNQAAQAIMLSVSYRKNAFQMSLLGSDSVVKAYNDLMQFLYQRGEAAQPIPPDDSKTMMHLLGGFLLAIRKSMGNESTKRDNWDMLEWFMTDARKWRTPPSRSTSR